MSILDDIATKLETDLDLYSTLKVDILGSADQAITIRHAPSAPSSRFYNKAFDNIVAFQILVKHTKQSLAISTIEEIAKYLDRLENLQLKDPDYTFIKCEINVNPTMVEQTQKGAFIYTALFETTIHVE